MTNVENYHFSSFLSFLNYVKLFYYNNQTYIFYVFLPISFQGKKSDRHVGLAWFDRAASQPGAGAGSFDINDDNPTQIWPLPAFPIKPEAISAFAS